MKTLALGMTLFLAVMTIPASASVTRLTDLLSGKSFMLDLPTTSGGTCVTNYTTIEQTIINNVTNVTNITNNFNNYVTNFSNFTPASGVIDPPWLTTELDQTYFSNPWHFVNSTYNDSVSAFMSNNRTNFSSFANNSQFCYSKTEGTLNVNYSAAAGSAGQVSCSGITGNATNLCTITQTSVTGFTIYNYTQADVITNSSTTYSEVLRIPLSANKKINIECELQDWANATGTGVQHQINITQSSSFHIMGRYFTSGTAIATCQGHNANVTCPAASSGGTILQPMDIFAYAVTGANTGTFMVTLKSELAGPLGYVNNTMGSWCRSIES